MQLCKGFPRTTFPQHCDDEDQHHHDANDSIMIMIMVESLPKVGKGWKKVASWHEDMKSRHARAFSGYIEKNQNIFNC